MLKNAAAFLAHQKSGGFFSVPVGGVPLSRAILNPLDAPQNGGGVAVLILVAACCLNRHRKLYKLDSLCNNN
jgi:hypothetical protein